MLRAPGLASAQHGYPVFFEPFIRGKRFNRIIPDSDHAQRGMRGDPAGAAVRDKVGNRFAIAPFILDDLVRFP
jgi:hypothetical protein